MKFLKEHWPNILLQIVLWYAYVITKVDFFLSLISIHLVSIIINTELSKLGKRVGVLEK